MDRNAEDALEQCKSVVNYLNEFNSSQSHEWEPYLVSARSAMVALDKIRFFREAHRFAEQVWLLNGFQNFAFNDPDRGVVQDIADWSQVGWLSVLRNYPDNVEALTGKFCLLTVPAVAARQPPSCLHLATLRLLTSL